MIRSRTNHRLSRLALLAAAIAALALPSAITLMAEDKAPAKPAATTKAATAPAKVKTPEEKRAEDIARVLDFFKENQPDVYENAVKLRATDPKKFEDTVVPAIPMVNSLLDLRERNPKLYALKIEDYHLSFQIGQTRKELTRPDISAKDYDALTEKLREQVTRQFDVGQLIRQQEIAGIEERIKKLQATLEQREKNKDSMIKQQMDRLVPPPGATAKKP